MASTTETGRPGKRPRLLLGNLLLLCLCGAAAGQRLGDGQPLPDSAAVHVDSTDRRTADPVWAWKRWKDIDRAVALRPLDGPQDILEKSEIIADRLDALGREGKRLQGMLKLRSDRHASLEIQVESLEDLADVQRGGDLQLRQRVHNLRADLRKAAQRMRFIETSLKEMGRERQRLEGLLASYEQKAEALRRQEGGQR